MSNADANRTIVERYWPLHYARRWGDAARFFGPDLQDADFGVDAVGSHGPAAGIARLGTLDVPRDSLEVCTVIVAQRDLVATA